MPSCHFCRAQLEQRKPVRTDSCPSCGRDVKVCLNCRFYDEGAHHKCRESQAEWVREKDKGNFCEYFQFRSAAGTGMGSPSGSGADRKQAAKKKLDDLFKTG
ncbi:MAG: hypothetical protein V2A71_03540 [Candidatus Eisenbacteria bacterium]